MRPFRLEALTFGLALPALIARLRPDVVFLSEWDTGQAIAALRRPLRQRFTLLLSNGGFAERGFEAFDHVQDLTPGAYDHVIALGADGRRHTMLPLGFEIPAALRHITPGERRTIRSRWGLPNDRPVLISVAALNSSHKRLDYLIGEVAALPEPRPFLLLVGQEEEETARVRALARARLPNLHDIRTVAPGSVRELVQASDAFVLASLAEMQGRAFIEAMALGVLCIGHAYPTMEFAGGDAALLGDLTVPGGLAPLVRRALAMSDGARRSLAERGHRHVYEHFSWERLRPAYVDFFQRLACEPRRW